MQKRDWRFFQRQVHGFLRKRVSDLDDVEDLTQDVLLKIHAHLQHNPWPKNPRQWLFRVTRNALIDYYRRKRPAESGWEQPVVWPEDQQVELEQEVAAWLHTFLEQLPEKFQAAVQAVDIEGISQKDFGLREGISYSGARSRVQRGRQALKAMLFACCQFAFDARGKILDIQPRGSCSTPNSSCCAPEQPSS